MNKTENKGRKVAVIATWALVGVFIIVGAIIIYPYFPMSPDSDTVQSRHVEKYLESHIK